MPPKKQVNKPSKTEVAKKARVRLPYTKQDPLSEFWFAIV
jgi:hypothetical protein